MEKSAVPPETRPDSSATLSAFGAMQAFGDMWARSSQAFFEGQQKWFGDLGKTALGQKPAFEPDTSGFKAAHEAYSTALANAMNVSSALMKSFGASNGASSEAEASFLPKIFDPQAWWASTPDFDASIARFQEAPQLADVGHIERKFAAVYSSMMALRQRSLEHQMLMTNAWTRAANTFMTRVGSDAKAFTGSWRDLMSRWIQIANDELIATQRSEEYLGSQRNLLKASTDLRLAQQELAGLYSDMFGMPARAEIDDVHKTVTNLRREVRALKRALKPVREQGHG
ncbi:MAG: poly-beta-hydroxybutyrate polymerase subunit [Methylobacteriaceae bacterium]|nr:poly-beta-hydroxybutyrate polymerase subunit [Methylobacteriaceae bacterium]